MQPPIVDEHVTLNIDGQLQTSSQPNLEHVVMLMCSALE